jgi:hypothetical protein
MTTNKKILLVGGALVLAYILLKKKKNTTISVNGKESLVPFDPTSVEKMPWVGVPDALPQIKIN